MRTQFFQSVDDPFMIYRYEPKGSMIVELFNYTEEAWVEDDAEFSIWGGEPQVMPITKEEADAAITSRKSALNSN